MASEEERCGGCGVLVGFPDLREEVERLQEVLRECREYVEWGTTGYCHSSLDIKGVLGRIDALLPSKPAEERMPDPIKVVTCPECGHPYCILPDTRDTE